LVALAASVILLASNLDNIPDCPELLNHAVPKATSVTVNQHHPAPVPIVLGRIAWPKSFEHKNCFPGFADTMWIALPCFIRIAQHAANTSPPNTFA
jgi:hypothetical protein